MLRTQNSRRNRRLDGHALMERMAGKTVATRGFGRQSPGTYALYRHADAFHIEPPPDGGLRVRNLIHRGAVRPVFKVPSLKLQRAVQCESLLEVDLAMLLDASPFVSNYREQPVTFHLVIGGKRRWHVPDFQVEQAGRRIYVEVKFKRDVDEYVLARTALLQHQVEQEGHSYLLLTEEDIRKQSWVANARKVLRRACHTIADTELIGNFERLRTGNSTTLRDWSWGQSQATEAIALARLLTQGAAHVDMSNPLTLETPVHATNGMEGEPWPLALSR